MELGAMIATFLGNIGGPVLVAIVMFLLGLVFQAGLKKSIRGGIYAGIGLAGLFVIVNNAIAVLTPALQSFSGSFAKPLLIADVGWGSAGIAFTWPGLAYTFLGVFAVNIILVLLGVVKTMWTDVWSIWHGQVVGGFVWALTGGNVLFGVIAAVVYLTIGSFIADYTAKDYQEFNDMPGISVPCAVTLLGVFAKPFNFIIEKIPGVRDINFSPQVIKDKLGVFGEIGVMGFIIGIFIGIVGKLPYGGVLNLAIQVGVLMVFLPKTVSVLCEGVIPIANSVTEFVQEKFEGRQLYVAVDCAALLGDPSVMATTLLVFPASVILAIILPGNNMLAIASLALVPYWVGAIAPFLKGNVFRMFLFTMIWMVPVFLIATAMAELHTLTMANLSLHDAANGLISSFDMGGDPLGYAIVKFFGLFGG
jgi:PTS system galactitol-specific IIC component